MPLREHDKSAATGEGKKSIKEVFSFFHFFLPSEAEAVGAAAVAAALAPEAARVDPGRAAIVAQGREPGVEVGD